MCIPWFARRASPKTADDLEKFYFEVWPLKQGGEGTVRILRNIATRELVVCKTGWRKRGGDHEVEMLKLVHNHRRIIDFHYFLAPKESPNYTGPSHLIIGYCQGGDLGDWTKVAFTSCKQQVPEPLLWHFYGQMAEAMSWLHDVCDVVHRDMKPDNVLVLPGGPGSVYPDIKIADFGFACQGVQPAEQSHVGTWEWWGPEPRPGTKEQDMWAVGAIIHWLALRIKPLDEEAAWVSPSASKATRRKAIQEAPRVVQSISDADTVAKCLDGIVDAPEAYSVKLDRWMRRALEPEPGKRITAKQLCEEFLEEAKHVVETEGQRLPDWTMPPAPKDDWGSDNSPPGLDPW